ncbi:MAG: SpoIIE family protein phosphatase, partial [Bacteroidetes bacterium]|nr:SpoIIE family protein phosphatase [Bacteroidota bacterium]
PDPWYPDRLLWIGTDGGGLNRFDLRDQRFVRYGRKQGLPNPVVYGILPDAEGRLWMSTNEGLCCFDPRTEHFRVYDVRDGLQADEFNRTQYYRQGSRLCFGGVDGYNIFDPSHIRGNTVVPSVALTAFRLFNREISLQDADSPLTEAIPYVQHIELAHDQNMFTIEFASLDFHAPDRNRYRYRLEGFTEDWIDAGTQRSATFTNLDPGEYVLHVIASNNHGVWNTEGVRLRIVISPPWWFTGWAIALYTILIVGALLGVDRVQRRRVILRERERAQIREAKFRAEAAELEVRVARAENERKQKEMQVAALIQQRVLPQQLTRIAGYDLAGINIPADEIGGDYYDCIPLRDGRVALVVADVTGKGVPASLLVSSLHASLRVHLDNDEDLPELVLRLNTFLYRSSPPSSFITFLIAVLQPETGELEIINAGHNPALLHRNGSILDTLRSKNLPLGCTNSVQQFASERHMLAPGEGMLLYTDGITEAMNGSREPFGQEALENLVRDHRDKPASLFVGNVIAEVQHYASDAEQSDDITVLYIRRLNGADTLR